MPWAAPPHPAILKHALPSPRLLGSLFTELAFVADLVVAGDDKACASPSRVGKTRERLVRRHLKAAVVALRSTVVSRLVMERSALHMARFAKDAVADAQLANT